LTGGDEGAVVEPVVLVQQSSEVWIRDKCIHLAVDEVVIGEGHLEGYPAGHLNVPVVIGMVMVALRLSLE